MERRPRIDLDTRSLRRRRPVAEGRLAHPALDTGTRSRPPYGADGESTAERQLREACGPNIKVTRTVTEGDSLRIGAGDWDLLHLPGHSPGHIALWNGADGVLILGDAVLGFGPPGIDGKAAMPPTHQLISSYLAIIERLKQLPVRLALTAHWPTLDSAGFAGLVRDSEGCVQRDMELVTRACRDRPMRFPDLLQLLNERFRTWPHDEDLHYMHALSGYLYYLMEQGVLSRQDDHFGVGR